ncbi:transposable element Tcb1 transposase [Trichonephila clavipes]|nr:transposable element Tcb1 transposase [Trichonephila clavipes]
MYGSTCADMQQLKSHRVAASARNQPVRRHLDAFTRGRIIGQLEEGRSVTSVAAEFGIAHSIVSRLWRQFQPTGTAIRGFSSGRPRGTTPADDRYIVLQARRNRRQTAGEIARHTTQATGRPISRFTVGQKTARWWSVCTTPCTVCTFNACPSEKAFSVVPGTPELEGQ